MVENLIGYTMLFSQQGDVFDPHLVHVLSEFVILDNVGKKVSDLEALALVGGRLDGELQATVQNEIPTGGGTHSRNLY